MQLPAADLYQKAAELTEQLWGNGFFLPDIKPNAVLQIWPGRAVDIVFCMKQIDSEQPRGQVTSDLSLLA